jgi:hypothetical protein
MRKIDNQITLNQTEKKNIREMLDHVRMDMDFGGAGTYNKSDPDNTRDDKAIKKSREAIATIEALLEHYL